MKFACHFNPKNRRSSTVAAAMALGCQRAGYYATQVPNFENVEADVCIAYGWGHPELFQKYKMRGGHFIYVDLGWWARKPVSSILQGHHKVVVDAREPNAYFRRRHPTDRLLKFHPRIAPWRTTGSHILLAGMSEKSARTRGLAPTQWEKQAVAIIRQICPQRPIVYRPKPSWEGAAPIPGTIYSPPTQPLEAALRGAWVTVAHHSNVTVDSLQAGVPIHCEGGVALEASTNMAALETPRTDCDRLSLLADVAYCQWSIPEISAGDCIRHLLKASPLCA